MNSFFIFWFRCHSNLINKSTRLPFFKRFPHYFLRPYDVQLHFNQEEFLEKLSTKNCEWMTRPNITLSEATQALCENWDLVKSGNFLHSTVADQMHNLLGPMTQTFANLDGKDKSISATSQDVYELM